MKVTTARFNLYRNLYWANQGLLHAVRSLQDAEMPTSVGPPSELLSLTLRRTQAMIEETRVLMNKILGEWVEGKD